MCLYGQKVVILFQNGIQPAFSFAAGQDYLEVGNVEKICEETNLCHDQSVPEGIRPV